MSKFLNYDVFKSLTIDFFLSKQCRLWVNVYLLGFSSGFSLFAKVPLYLIQNEKS